MSRVELRFYIDPATREPHIYEHGVSEEEVEEVLSSPRAEERPGRNHSRVVIGSTVAGRILRVVYSSDPYPGTLFVITAYDVRGKPLAAYRRRQRHKRR